MMEAEKGNRMINAIVALKVDRRRIQEVAERVADLRHVSEVYSVSGRWDLIAMVRAPDTEALAGIVTGELLKMEVILDSETMLAFRAHSRHDLDAIFSIGSP